MIVEKIITFEKEVIEIIDKEEVLNFIECSEKEATYKLIRRPMKHRLYNQEFPTLRIKI